MGNMVVEKTLKVGKRTEYLGWRVSEGGLGRRHGGWRIEGRRSGNCWGDENGHCSTSERGKAVFAGSKAETRRAFCAGRCRRTRRVQRPVWRASGRCCRGLNMSKIRSGGEAGWTTDLEVADGGLGSRQKSASGVDWRNG
jgi:hypothetical protein